MSAIGTSALSTYQSSIKSSAGNITASGADGAKGVQQTFVAQGITTSRGTSYVGVKTQTIHRVDVAGEIRASSQQTHLAVSGDGFFTVVDPSGELRLTRRGAFEKDATGNLTIGDATLVGWKLDEEGRKPGDIGNIDQRAATLTDSLDKVNLAGILGDAKATTEVGVDGRFDASQPVFKGAGQTFKFSSSDAFNRSLKDTDPIIPNGDSIQIGDKVRIKVKDTTEEYVFGGVTTSFKIDKHPVYGQKSADSRFNGVADGETLRVTINGISKDLKFTAGTPEPSKLQFNSLTTLANALNQVDGISARVKNDTLAIASEDGSSEVTFSNVAGATFKETLGISDIPADGGVKRFATMGNLLDHLREFSDVTVSKVNGGLSITSKLPTDAVTFTTIAERKVGINYASATQVDVDDADASARANHIKIHAPNSGLKAGDFVKLDGFNLAHAELTAGALNMNGAYRIITKDADSFTIAAPEVIVTGGNGTTKQVAVPAGATWKKVTGTESSALNVAPHAQIVNAAHVLTLSNLGDMTAGQPHALAGIADNDVVYISGYGRAANNGATFYVPDGYYQVTGLNAAAGQFDITLPVASADGHYAAAAATGKNMSIAKVGTTGANFQIDTSVTFENSGIGAPINDDLVRIKIPNAGYAVGDYIGIGGAAINGFEVATDGVAKRFKIEHVGDDFVEINVGQAARDLLTGGNFDFAANYIDHFSQFDKSVGFLQEKDGTALDATFNVEPGGKNLTTNLEGKFEEAITVYDEQGISHDLRLAYLKIGVNKWAVTLYSPKNATTGESEVNNDKDGIIATSFVEFNPNGSVNRDTLGDFDAPIQIVWENGTGAGASEIHFRLAPPLPNEDAVYKSSSGIVQLKGASGFSHIVQNGHAPGKLTGITIDGDTGIVNGEFDNGESKALWQIPLAYVAAANQLVDTGNGLFVASSKSGPVILREAGGEGVGTMISGAVEGSNIEAVDEVMDLTDKSTTLRFIMSAVTEQRDALRELARG